MDRCVWIWERKREKEMGAEKGCTIRQNGTKAILYT